MDVRLPRYFYSYLYKTYPYSPHLAPKALKKLKIEEVLIRNKNLARMVIYVLNPLHAVVFL